MPEILVQNVVVGALEVNCYIVRNVRTMECVVIDPGDDAPAIIEAMGSSAVRAILLTHGHWDHIGAVDALLERYPVPVYIHSEDAGKLHDPEANCSRLFGTLLASKAVPCELHDGEVLSVAGFSFDVMHSPGHSAGSVCYLLKEEHIAFTGDTLFAHGYGRTDFSDGDFSQLFASLRKLFRLHPRYIAYPGHGESGFAGSDPQAEA